MKKISFLLVICCVVAACSDESALKKKGLELAQAKFEENLKAEAQEGVPQSPVLQQAYIDFMHLKSEVRVSSVKIQNPTSAVVATSLTTYSKKLRQTLLSVAQGVGPDKTRRFNFADAIPMVSKKTGVKTEVEEQPFEVYLFQKQSDKWVPLQ